jgi:hypothetical protein
MTPDKNPTNGKGRSERELRAEWASTKPDVVDVDAAWRAHVSQMEGKGTASRRTIRRVPGLSHTRVAIFAGAVIVLAAGLALGSVEVVHSGSGTTRPSHRPTPHITLPTTFTTTCCTTTTEPGPSSTTSSTTVPNTVPPTTPKVPRTEQITYQPFVGSEVNPSLKVVGRDSGECFRYGGGADGRYYYRCPAIQPCFAGPMGTSAPLVCPAGQDPTTGDVILWTATSVGRSFGPSTSKTPWAMQLSNGVVCSFVAAAWGGLGPYGCEVQGSKTPADCRTPVQAAPYWTAKCQHEDTDASPFNNWTVARVWF